MGALVKRMHHELGQHALVSRAMVFGFTKLLPAQTQEEKAVARMKAELAKLERRVPDRVHARHMFFRDMMQLSNERQRAERRQQGRSFSLKLMSHHSALFAKLAPWQLAGYEDQAELRRGQSRQEVEDKQWSLREKIRLEQHRAEEAKKGRHQLSMTECKLQPGEMKQLGEDWRERSEGYRAAKGVRMKALCTAPKVDTALQTKLHQIIVPDRSLLSNPDAAKPKLARGSCLSQEPVRQYCLGAPWGIYNLFQVSVRHAEPPCDRVLTLGPGHYTRSCCCGGGGERWRGCADQAV